MEAWDVHLRRAPLAETAGQEGAGQEGAGQDAPRGRTRGHAWRPSARSGLVACILGALLSWVLPGFAAADEAASGAEEAPGWVIGRTPAVFGPDRTATRVGGWLDASYQDNDVSSESINLNHLNFFFDTRFGTRWQAFLEVEFENEPRVRGFEGEREYEVEQVYGRWIASDRFGVRVGQFNTPFGIWTPLHWAILMDTITEPIHEGTRVTPEQQTGIELAGRVLLDDWLTSESELTYSVYAGYGNETALFQNSGTSGASLGTDLKLRLREQAYFGLSTYRQTRAQDDAPDRSEQAWMLYGELRPLDPLTLRFELFRQYRDRHVAPMLSRNINIGYVKARWDFTDQLYLNYRYNYGDDETEGASDERHTHTVTLGLRPNSTLRLKLEYAGTEFRSTTRRDFHYWGFSIGALF